MAAFTKLKSSGIKMWGYLSFTFLFMFLATFEVSVNLIHLNEVFNSFSHAYTASFVVYNYHYDKLVFDPYSLENGVKDYFLENINATIKYIYTVTFYYDKQEVRKSELVNNFTITLQGDVGFFVTYDKTFRYYIV